jgi:YHS domain-containing protein
MNRFKNDEKMIRDPICGMVLDEHDLVIKRKYNGKIYYFCSFTCRDLFSADPEKYVVRLYGTSIERKNDPWQSAANFNR